MARGGFSYFFSSKTVPLDSAFIKQVARLVPVEQEAEYESKPASRRTYLPLDHPKTYGNADPPGGELFEFDPNTITPGEWKRLGLKDKTIQTIQHYLAKGGHFRKPEDIRNVYGLWPDQAEKLLPYVRIKPIPEANRTDRGNEYPQATARSGYTRPPPVEVDINLADTSTFIALPGIGSKLAGRIISFREKLGGFYAVAQLGETFGLPDSVFQKIKSRFTCGNFRVKQINLNEADLNTLKTHPYIRWNFANAIVRYREEHGRFSSVSDLKNIAIIDAPALSKITPYLSVE